jgi:class 3 adenylate cyclase/streptogramin lyase
VAQLPAGTVAFLFTDIEGSTALLRSLGDDYAAVLRDHHCILATAVEARGGRIVDTQGDAVFAVLPRAKDAAAAAAEAQRALASQPWPGEARVKVRMGIHVAEPELDGDRYVGLGVHRGARIGATAHGGQVLLSNTAASLLGDGQFEVRRLGTFPLKDFDHPEPLSQLVVDGLPSQFPPPRTSAGIDRRRRLLSAGLVGTTVVLVIAVAAIQLIRGDEDPATLGATSVGVVDPASNRVVDDVPIGFTSPLIAASAGDVWVADPKGSVLVRIDAESREVVERTAIEAGAVPTSIAAGGGSVWIAVVRPDGERALLEVGAEHLERRRTIEGVGAPSHGMTLARTGLWLIDADQVALLHVAPRATRPERVTDDIGAARSIAVDGDVVWIGGADDVRSVDALSGAGIDLIPLGSIEIGVTDTSSIAAANGSAWFAASADDAVWQIASESSSAKRSVSVGIGTSGVAVDRADVWVAGSQTAALIRVDPSTGDSRTIPLGATPGGVVVASGLVWTSPGVPMG